MKCILITRSMIEILKMLGWPRGCGVYWGEVFCGEPYLSAIQMKAPEIIDFRGFFVACRFAQAAFPLRCKPSPGPLDVLVRLTLHLPLCIPSSSQRLLSLSIAGVGQVDFAH